METMLTSRECSGGGALSIVTQQSTRDNSVILLVKTSSRSTPEASATRVDGAPEDTGRPGSVARDLAVSATGRGRSFVLSIDWTRASATLGLGLAAAGCRRCDARVRASWTATCRQSAGCPDPAGADGG